MASVGQALRKFFEQSARPVLFTGAGVSVRAGLPTWKGLIELLAEGVRSADPLTTQQMYECSLNGDYTRAIDYFSLSHKILDGDKHRLLKRILSDFDSTKLQPIARLPFHCCLTTNFDRSILDAVSKEKGKAPLDYRYGDHSFKQAQWEESMFVARIHGAVEMPESMVLSDGQFRELLKSETYADLLRAVFLHRNVLFVGFSFYDPAVRHIFDELNRRFGPATPGRHMVLVPTNIGSEFLQRANRLNIEAVYYDPAEDHSALWNGIADFNSSASQATVTSAQGAAPFGSTKRFLAACYARMRSEHASESLRSALLEGIVSAILQDAAPIAVSRKDILEKIRVTVGLKEAEAGPLLDTSLKALLEASLARRTQGSNGGTKFAWAGQVAEGDSLDSAIESLADSLIKRAMVQEGWRPSEAVHRAVRSFFDNLIRKRGWDLGAAFAARRAPENVAVESLISECARGLPAFDKERLQRVAQSMFQQPTVGEAELLAELGRVSFAVELAFQSPRSVLLHNSILPRHIYFDASVLMPAVVSGHPFGPIYSDAIKRLKHAASASAVDLKLRVCTIYLNEIISHRSMAEEYSKTVGNNFPTVARSDALYNGVTNVNVFVGAYANWIHTSGTISFSEFLARFAPYRTEAELSSWLRRKGFEIIKASKGPSYTELYSVLERAYADKFLRGKRPILIDHDSMQLSLLHDHAQQGDKALFVTADRRLHEAATESKFFTLADMMVSHVGLVQIIDLLVGIKDGAALTQLLWSSRSSDRTQAVRAYLTARCLEQYDDAMAMSLPDMIDRFADKASTELARAGADLDAEQPSQRAAAFRMLGSLEKEYFSGMSEAVKKLRARVDGESPRS